MLQISKYGLYFKKCFASCTIIAHPLKDSIPIDIEILERKMNI